MRPLRMLAAYAAVAAALLLGVEDAGARLEGATSFGKSGLRDFMFTPVEASALTTTAVLDHAATGPPANPGGSLGGLFSRPGLVPGFSAGFLGAGLLGLVFGHGLFGGLNGVASLFGLMLQLALLVMLARLIWSWWHGRDAPAFAGLSPRQQAEAYLRSRNDLLPGNFTPTSADDAMGDTAAMPSCAGSAKTCLRSELDR
jgi:predicted lipid-binding transport protein (Tim44 family)